jgi:class 3 adenylate cyclase
MSLAAPVEGHFVRVGGRNHPVFYRRVEGYGPEPLYVGVYFKGRTEEVRRLIMSAAAGVGTLLVAFALALYVGRRIGRPAKALAAAARDVRDLRLAGLAELAPSRLRELDEAATALNAMGTALRWFETYVPRALVRRLIARETAEIASEDRTVTVLFTDIVSFTGLAEKLSAAAAARLLNGHFSLLAGCIESTGGTIDKYIGDSVMAFWGAPEEQTDHAVAACCAARAIRAAVRRDNGERAVRGEPAVRVRIGLHTGQAIVGNIGAPGRINYTLVGDTVNVAQRLVELGKTLTDPIDDAAILVTAEVASAVGSEFALSPRGAHQLRGRAGGIEVYALEA